MWVRVPSGLLSVFFFLNSGKRRGIYITRDVIRYVWITIVFTMHQWSYGVTVSTLDSESSDGGSNPPRTFFIRKDIFRSMNSSRNHRES